MPRKKIPADKLQKMAHEHVLYEIQMFIQQKQQMQQYEQQLQHILRNL